MSAENKDVYTVGSYVTDTGVHITVRHPILTQDEYERRLNHARGALLHLYEVCMKLGIPWQDDEGDE
jgi:hypothetical protein